MKREEVERAAWEQFESALRGAGLEAKAREVGRNPPRISAGARAAAFAIAIAATLTAGYGLWRLLLVVVGRLGSAWRGA